MAIRINAKELKELLTCTPPSQNIMLVGKHGIGKSEILTEHFTQHNMGVVALFLGQMSDPGDLIGLPRLNTQSGRTEFMPPYWWPADGLPIALFLDELNRARPELLQSVQDLALNRTLAGRKLPEGSVIIAAINAGDEYQLTDLDPALISRFNIYEFAPEIEEWVAWAIGRKLDKRVVSFIEKNGTFLDSSLNETSDETIEKTPDRRAWVRVSQLIAPHQKLTPLLIKFVAGIVGVTAAMAFRKFIESAEAISADQLLNDFNERLIEGLNRLSLPDLIYLNKQLVRWIEERGSGLVGKKRQKVLENVERYIDYLKQGEKREAVADLINLAEKGNFAHVSALLLESPKILKTFEHYIQKVKL